jgi:hypothetical protein
VRHALCRMVVFLIPLVLTLAGCGGGGTAGGGALIGKGAVALSVDLNALTGRTPAKAVSALIPVITSARVDLTRSGFPDITQDMAIAGNIATIRINNLDQGYWHITVHVFSDTAEIYTGTNDTNVIPGAVSQVNILFDPVVVVPTTGSIAISAGINPMPGYKAVNQQITKALLDEGNNKLYIYDATTKTVGVYNADTFIRTGDITLASAPATVAFTAGKDALLLGYASGQVYKLNLATGTTTLIGDVLMDVKSILALDNRIALVSSQSGSQSAFKTLDLVTGQVLGTKSYYYYFGDFILNQANGVIYAQDINVSPTDLFRVKVDLATGAITEIADSPYHGDYNLGQPLRLIRSGSRLVTAAGTIFSTSSIATQDLLYSGSLGFSYIDLAVDEAKDKIYLLNNGSPFKLLKLNQANYFLETTVDLLGIPKQLLVTPTKIIVITAKDSVIYTKVFDKTELGM